MVSPVVPHQSRLEGPRTPTPWVRIPESTSGGPRGTDRPRRTPGTVLRSRVLTTPDQGAIYPGVLGGRFTICLRHEDTPEGPHPEPSVWLVVTV